MHLTLYDNNYNGVPLLDVLNSSHNVDFSENEIKECEKDLKSVANESIKKLSEKNPNLLIYPENWQTHKDDIGELKILELAENQLIKTSNLMGFIGVGQTTISIKSRFDKDSTNDNFLHYMLSRVFKINLVNYTTSFSEQDQTLNLLYFVFPRMLQKALTKGVFRVYKTFKRNDSAVKGPIDIARHIKNNLPFNGKIAYKSREFSYDNEITQLIRHTIEVIKLSDFGKTILTNNEETRLCVNQIMQATPTYSKRDRLTVVCQNKRPLKHSYYSEYADLQKLCLAILRKKTLAFSKNQNNEIYGIIFDGAWLWEEYLWTVIKDCGFLHPENKVGKRGIYLFEKWENSDGENIVEDKTYHSRYRRYPDFYKKDEFILDAKYKKLEDRKIPRDDIHQIISYMYVEKASKGGLIYPINGEKSVQLTSIGTLRGYGGVIENYGFPIPQDEAEYLKFVENMKNFEKELKQKLKQI